MKILAEMTANLGGLNDPATCAKVWPHYYTLTLKNGLLLKNINFKNATYIKMKPK